MIDFVKGVVGLERILEYDLDLASEIGVLRPRHFGDVVASVDDFAGCGFDQSENGSGEGCLAAAAFASDCGDSWGRLWNAEGNRI